MVVHLATVKQVLISSMQALAKLTHCYHHMTLSWFVSYAFAYSKICSLNF